MGNSAYYSEVEHSDVSWNTAEVMSLKPSPPSGVTETLTHQRFCELVIKKEVLCLWASAPATGSKNWVKLDEHVNTHVKQAELQKVSDEE